MALLYSPAVASNAEGQSGAKLRQLLSGLSPSWIYVLILVGKIKQAAKLIFVQNSCYIVNFTVNLVNSCLLFLNLISLIYLHYLCT